MKKVLIGGGSGFIGQEINRLLSRCGWQVCNISRKSTPNGITWGDVERNGLPDCNAVLNLAGENMFIPFRRWDEAYRKAVTDSRIGTNRLLASSIAAASKPPAVWVTTSAEGYYPLDNDRSYTEDSTVTPSDKGHSYFSRLCADWEESGKLPDDCSTRHCVVRVGLVLGAEGGILKQLWPQYWLGLGGPVGTGDYPFCWVHVSDLARLYQFAIEQAEVCGVLNGIAPGVVKQRDFAKAFGAAMGRPAILPTPGFVMKLLFGDERGEFSMQGKNIFPQRVLDLGFKFHYPDITSCLNDLVR